jgi:predicted DNA-binding transcriptional regulator AlpA
MQTESFDSKPDSSFVGVQEVAKLLGMSVATVWRSAKNGTLPAPRKIAARCTRWQVGELRQVLGLSK